MMYVCNPLMRKLIFMPLIFTLVNCGGGGGGSGSSSTSSISYTGSTSQAVITQANGEEIAYSAYQNGGTGNSLGGVLGIQQAGSNTTSRPRMLVLSRALRKSIDHISLDHDQDSYNTGATVSQSTTIPGGCGGNATYSISIDDVTYDFTGTFSFSAYCDEGATLSGNLTFTGQFNPDTLVFGLITMSYDNLTVTAGNDSFTADGDMTLDPSSTPISVTLNMVMLDNSTDKTYRAENFVMTVTDNLTSVSMTIVGRLYDPDYGYVDITTPTPLVISSGDTYPSSGVLLATGSNGSSGGPAKVKLTVLSNTSYQIEIDEDGDGTYEYLDTGNWADL